jgi:hypothetical protein
VVVEACPPAARPTSRRLGLLLNDLGFRPLETFADSESLFVDIGIISAGLQPRPCPDVVNCVYVPRRLDGDNAKKKL